MTKKHSAIGRRYDWIPDLPDHRDKYFLPRRDASLPPSVDLSPRCSPVEDQGNLGACTAHALAGALEFLEDKDGVPFKDVSRLMIYYNERAIEQSISRDAGAEIRDGVRSLHQTGVCDEVLWPYEPENFKTRPSLAAYADAATRKIDEYRRVIGIDAMRACLAEGYPFAFGFTVYEGFESDAVARAGELQMPRPSEQCLGGHAVLAVGYNDADRRVLVRNSWGRGWGINGYFWMPYDYIGSAKLADDAWTIRKGSSL